MYASGKEFHTHNPQWVICDGSILKDPLLIPEPTRLILMLRVAHRNANCLQETALFMELEKIVFT